MPVFPTRRIFIMADPYTPKNMARLLNGLSWEVAQGAPLARHHVKADMALPMPVCAPRNFPLRCMAPILWTTCRLSCPEMLP